MPSQLIMHAPEPSFLDSVLLRLRERMRPEQFDSWFRGIALGRFSEESVEYCVATGFIRDWLNKHYLDKIQAATQEVLMERGERERRVSIGLDGSLAESCDELLADAEAEGTDQESAKAAITGVFDQFEPESLPVTPQGSGTNGSPTTAGSPQLLAETLLNRDYTFDNFVVGGSNQLPHSAALAVGQNPGRAYNPLFIHGNVGLGKTHLLQSICHSIKKRGGGRVVYLSCEEFTNRFIQAIQLGKLDVFREYYRSADVLVIDDIQFLSGKEKTQEEFFHTFNTLYNAQFQIVISSDKSPADIATVQERLVSRFKWGLVTDIQPPSFQTRLAIVKRKALMRSAEVNDEVAQFIAERVTANIREVEGAVIKVIGVSAITDRPITLALAEEALQGVTSPHRSQIAIPDVINIIGTEFAVSARDLTGKSRTQKISLPRQIAMHLARKYTEHTLEEIGLYFNRDHTTVMYALTKIKQRCETDRLFRDLVAKLCHRIEAS